jgi:subtilisin family serine protease
MWRGRVQIRTLLLVAGLTSASMLACSNSEAPELSIPAKLTLVSGDAQTANGAAVPTPLTVRVSDVRDNPRPGVTVNWSASDGALSAASSTTDDQGLAKVTWTLGAAAGRQTVTATTPSITGAQVVFQANNGGVISGGITVQNAPPVAFGSLLSKGAQDAGSVFAPTGATRQFQPSRTAAQLKAQGLPTRRLLVEFKEIASVNRIATGSAGIQANRYMMRNVLAPHLAMNRVSRMELSPAILTARVSVPDGVSLEQARAALEADPSVASVTEDRIYPMLAPHSRTPAEVVRFVGDVSASTQPLAGAVTGVVPNDPFHLYAMWHYNLVDVPRAWKTQTGSKTVLVAVVDNGIRFDHPSMGLLAASNITNDGYNFVAGGDRLPAPEPVCAPAGPLGATTTLHENGPGPDPTAPDDLDFDPSGCWYRSDVGNHGLHVAGTIGAPGNDGVGIAGINWLVSIRPVRALDITGSGSFFDIAQGVLYAAGLPAATDTLGHTVTAPSRAAIINMSLGGSANFAVLRNAVTAATNAGSLIIASAGNSESSRPSYPAGYPEVLAVAAVGPDLSISSYTNVGGNVSLSAPGGNFRSSSSSGVVSNTWDFVTGMPTYALYQGTSMSAPHVTGIAALVLAASPGLTNTQLRARLQNTAVHVGAPGRNDQYGYGLVNAYNAVTNTQGPTRALYVRVVNATTGTLAQQVKANADGSFSVARLPAATYYVFAGEDEAGDAIIGVPGRRFGWYGGASGPATITITNGGNGSASITVGTPAESKPHSTIATANKLVVNSYMVGQITATDQPGIFSIMLPAAGTYYFEAGSVLGTCGLGIELNTQLDILDATGATLASSDNAGIPGVPFCSAINGTVSSGGQFYMRVSGAAPRSGAPTMQTGQYRVWVRDQP